MITKVTITGADNSINPVDLLVLSYKYPFVEWGILVSKNNYGTNRFPSIEWLYTLENAKNFYPSMKLSCHICGKYVRDLCSGSASTIEDLWEFWYMFDRIQLNFHNISHKVNEDFIDLLSEHMDKEFIFQFDDVNNQIINAVHEAGINCSALFDTSGGNGILPTEWPDHLGKIKCGYAGGLSPDNLKEQIRLIGLKTRGFKIWIDMESHVRSNNDYQFDLKKVEECLKIAEKFIEPEIHIPYV